MRTIMKPPPPMLPASGFTTARANCTAIAASTAFPPASRMSTPTRLASSSVVTTMPLAAVTGSGVVRYNHPAAKSGASAGSTSEHAVAEMMVSAARMERLVMRRVVRSMDEPRLGNAV